MGVLRWVDYIVSDKSYFKLNTDHTPLHLVLVDEVNFFFFFFPLAIDFFLDVAHHFLCIC